MKILKLFWVNLLFTLLIINISSSAKFLKYNYGAYSSCINSALPGVGQPLTWAERTDLFHWENGANSISIRMNSAGAGDDVTPVNTSLQISSAAAAWSNVTSSFMDITLDGSGGEYGFNSTDGYNSIKWEESPTSLIYTTCLGANTLTISIIKTNAQNEIQDVDIALNGVAFYWVIYPDSGQGDNPDIQSNVAHELGHLLGLGHTDIATNIPTMFVPPAGNPNLAMFSTLGRTLETDDINGVTYLYRKDVAVPTNFPSLASAIAYASSGSGQVIRLQYGNTYIVDANLTIKSGLTIICEDGSDIVVNAGVTLSMNPLSTIIFYPGSRLTVNGALNAAWANFISNQATHDQDWDGIYLNGGPNTLSNCLIDNAIYGIVLINNQSTTTVDHTYIQWCQNYGIFSSSSGVNSLSLQNVFFFQNVVGLGLVNNAWASLSSVDIENSWQYGVYALNSQLFMSDVDIFNGYGVGMLVEGSSSNVRFSPNGSQPGYNMVQNNIGGQVRRTGGTVLIGKKTSICVCDENSGVVLSSTPGDCLPPCYTQQYSYAGYNTIIGSNPWVRNDGSPGIYAHLTYWGSPYECPPQSSHFIGSVYSSYPLGCSTILNASQPISPLTSDGLLGDVSEWTVPEDPHLTIAMIKDLLRVIRDYPDSADDAIPIIATYFDHDGEYEYLLPTSWDSYLSKLATLSTSPSLRSIARVYQIQARMNARNYTGAIELITKAMKTALDDQTWFYCKSQLISAYLGLGEVNKVETEYLSMVNRGSRVSGVAVSELDRVINLTSNRFFGMSTMNYNASEKNHDRAIQNPSHLFDTYPNPFNPITNISYYLGEDGQIFIAVYDVLGREIAVLVDEFQKSGLKQISFDGNNLTSGIYYYRIHTDKYSEVKKMILMK